MKQVIHT